MTEDETLNRLATRLHEANAALASQDNREDQRLIEQAQGAAERIEARAVEAEAAYAEFEAYGVRKANERVVVIGAVSSEMLKDAADDLDENTPMRWQFQNGELGRSAQSPNPYPNGHDGPSTEE